MITYLLLGCLTGAISGLLPGIGNTVVMSLMFPFLIYVDPMNVIVFYIATLSIGQYTGSVSATVFSVPGESSSLPAVKEGHRLYRRGLGALSLSGCALGSLVGSIFAVGFVLYVSQYLANFTFLYSTKFLSAVLILVLLFLVFGRHNKWYVNLVLCGFGYFLASIGTGSLYEYQTVTFGIDALIRGIPMFCVIAWLYVWPEILKNWEIDIPHGDFASSKIIPLVDHLAHFVRHFTSVLRGAFFGFFLGLTPYLTTIVASNVTYNFEVWLRKKKDKYSDDGDYGSLVAAETANNSAALSALVPLLLLGIPITSSEAILLEIVSVNGFNFDVENFYGLFVTISYCLVAINVIGLCVAWPLTRYFNVFYRLNIKVIYAVVLFFCVCVTLYIGVENNALMYYIVVGAIFSVIGFFLRKVDTMPVIFVFMMQDGIESNLTRLLHIM
jgi:putative tricarboxylic transport membrane protein